MIAYIQGIVHEVEKNSIIVMTAGVGYRLFVPAARLTEFHKGDEIALHVYHNVSEYQQDLYGFVTKDEYDAFELLLSVSGIGPKNALGVLSKSSVTLLFESITKQDAQYLHKAGGVGLKTAEKIVLGLKNKLSRIPQVVSEIPSQNHDVDVIDALCGLGYTPDEARYAMASLPAGQYSTSEKVSAALKFLGQKVK